MCCKITRELIFIEKSVVKLSLEFSAILHITYYVSNVHVRTKVWYALRVKEIIQSVPVHRIMVDEILPRKSNDFFPGYGETVLNRTVRLTYIRRGWHKPINCFLLTPASDRFVGPSSAVDLFTFITFKGHLKIRSAIPSRPFIRTFKIIT